MGGVKAIILTLFLIGVSVLTTSCATKPAADAIKVFPRISPDGTRLVYLTPYNEVMNICVRTLNEHDDKILTSYSDHAVWHCFWGLNNEQILFTRPQRDQPGWDLYAIPITGGRPLKLNPEANSAAWVIGESQKFPDEILIMLGHPGSPNDVYRVNTKTGTKRLVFTNDSDVSRFIVDREWQVRIVQIVDPEGKIINLSRENSDSEWDTLMVTPQERANQTVLFSTLANDGETVYMVSKDGAEHYELQSLNVSNRERMTVAADSARDLFEVMLDPETGHPLAVCFDRVRWEVLDQSIAPHLNNLSGMIPNYFSIVGWVGSDYFACKGKIWLIRSMDSNEIISYYLYDSERMAVKPLFRTPLRYEQRPF